MAQKTLETIIRDLHKQIGILTTKIDALESKIDDQSRIIAIQEQTTSALKLAVEGKLLPFTTKAAETPPPEVEDHPAPPRPIRQARINAAQKKVSLLNAAKKPAVTSRRASISETPTTCKLVRADPSTELGLATTASPAAPACSGERKPIGPSVTESGVGKNSTVRSSCGTGNQNTEGDDDNWKIVGTKKKTRRPITVGVGKKSDELQAIERLKYIQAWSFRPDTTAEKVMSFLNNIVNSNDYTVEKRTIKTVRHASFLIGIPENIYNEITTPTAWPPGVRFVPWIPFRQRPHKEWGNVHSEAASAEQRTGTAAARAAGACAR